MKKVCVCGWGGGGASIMLFELLIFLDYLQLFSKLFLWQTWTCNICTTLICDCSIRVFDCSIRISDCSIRVSRSFMLALFQYIIQIILVLHCKQHMLFCTNYSYNSTIYSRIFLNSFHHLLFQKLFQHNRQVPRGGRQSKFIQKPVTIFPDDNGAVLVRSKQAFRSCYRI